MTDQELEVILKSLDIVGYLIGAISGAAITWFVTKKDRELNERIAKKERQDKHKIFLLENRVEEYQKIYSLCYDLLINIGKPHVLEAVAAECREWWNANCLYVEKEVRELFFYAHSPCLELMKKDGDKIIENKQICFEKSIDTLRAIEKKMDLPKTDVETISS